MSFFLQRCLSLVWKQSSSALGHKKNCKCHPRDLLVSPPRNPFSDFQLNCLKLPNQDKWRKLKIILDDKSSSTVKLFTFFNSMQSCIVCTFMYFFPEMKHCDIIFQFRKKWKIIAICHISVVAFLYGVSKLRGKIGAW